MKALVVYDSTFGNTERVAQNIGDRLGASYQVSIMRVGDFLVEHLKDLDLLIVGSPTQRFNPTSGTTQFLKTLPSGSLRGIDVAAFDTRLTVEEIESLGILSFFVRIFGYAAEPIARRLKSKGGVPTIDPAGFYVEGMEGPLVAGEFERAGDWAKQIAGIERANKTP